MMDDFDLQQSMLQQRIGNAQRNKQFQPAQGRQVGGVYIAPNPLEQLAAGIRAFGAQNDESMAMQELQGINQKRRDANEADVSSYVQALKGSAATPEALGNNPSAYTPPQAGVAPDRSKAMAIALRSQNPMLQKAGGDMLSADADQAQLQQILGGGTVPGAPGAPGATGPTGGSPGGLPGVDQRAMALLLSKSPQLNKLGEAYQTASKPIALREGDLVLPDGQGGFRSAYSQPKLEAGIVPMRGPNGQVTGAQALPGYAEARAGQTTAVERAKAGLDTQVVDTADGPRLMTRAQAADQASGAQAPRLAASEQQMRQQASGDMGADPAAIRREIAASSADLARVPDQASKAMLQEHINGLQAKLGSVQGQASAPAAPASSGPGIALQDDSAKKFGSQVASKSADMLVESRDKAKAASDDLLSVQQAKKTIKEGAFQGSGAETKLAIAKFVNANVPGINIDPNKVGNTDYLQSTLGMGVLSQAKTLGANPSNADAARITDIVGSIGKDPQAMNKLLDFRQEMANRAITNHNKMVDDAEQRGMKPPVSLRVTTPSATPGASGGFRIIEVK